MKQRFRYDRSKSPAAPILPVRIGVTAGRREAALAAIVDTGADISVIPAALAKDLHLPVVGEVTVRGLIGSERVPLYGTEIEVAGVGVPVQVAGMGAHTLVGRDVLNRWTLVLRGPQEALEIESGGADGSS